MSELWTAERVRLLHEGVAASRSLHEMASAIGLTWKQVQSRRWRDGLNPPKLWWTPERVEMFRSLHAQGLEDWQIAEHFGRHAKTIGFQRGRLKLPKNHSKSTRWTRWTEERQALLSELLQIGYSSSLIADRINAKFATEYSRSAVIGRSRRLNLSRPHGTTISIRPPSQKPRLRRHLRSLPGPDRRFLKPEPIWRRADEIADEAIPVEQRIAYCWELRKNDCRWPVGDPQEDSFFYCGAAKIEGHSYCAGHCRVAYLPERPRKFTNFYISRMV